MKQRISVRGLIEFIYRSGDIDQSFKSSTRQLEGQEVHRVIQNAFELGIDSEVSLTLTVVRGDLELEISGRADGVRLTDEPCVVEIKSTRRNLDDIEEPLSMLHLYQGMLYGYMVAEKENFDALDVLLIYGQPQGKSIKTLKYSYTRDELSLYFEKTIDIYSQWMQLTADLKNRLIDSAASMAFPFPYRIGQHQLAKSLYRSIQNEKILLVEAPTGIGKTLSVLYPALKANDKNEIDKIFYLTPKTTGRENAKRAFLQLQQAGLKASIIEIQAKEKLCLNQTYSCNPMDCPYAAGHFDRINAALYEALTQSSFFDVTTISTYANAFKVCPFEFALDLSLFCAIIICDYNYVWDPDVQLKRFFSEKKQHVLLVDEAHNLVERSRAMYSAELTREALKKAIASAKGKSKKLHSALQKLHTKINAKMKVQEDAVVWETTFPLWLYEACMSVKGAFEAEEPEVLNALGEPVLDMYFSVLSYLKRLDYFGEEFVHFYRREGKSQFTVQLFCRDAGRMLKAAFSQVKTLCLFSATLSPMAYFKQCFGLLGEEINALRLGSPYPPEHLKIMIEPYSTRYKDRDQTLNEIALCIENHLMHKKGNSIVFFPSYDYLNRVYSILSRVENRPLIVQKRAMTEMDRTDFLDAFTADEGAHLTGLCVLGGVFSEGIDLKADRLSLVIVVGVGLPMIGPELQLIEAYYTQLGFKGYDYTYTIPGMIRVLQAGGRLIRDGEDKGRLILIDDRYETPLYHGLLPPHWKASLVKGPKVHR